MKIESRDLVVLGAGPGGYTAAIRAAQLGRKVSLIERDALGGVCLNWGCIPSKALLHSARMYQETSRASKFGLEISNVKINFPKIIDRSRKVASRLSQGVAYLMKKNGIEVLKGNARLTAPGSLQVKNNGGVENSYSFVDIILAPGARPRMLPNLHIDGQALHNSRTILEQRRLPQKLLVVGAGAIGLEFAYFFHTLGTKVTVVEMLDQILPTEDTELAGELEKIFRARGMNIKCSAKIETIKSCGKTVSAVINNGGTSEKWSGDCCLVAIGVKPNTEQLGLEAAAIETKKGFIKTDQLQRTSAAHHYAIGDAAGPPLLAHKASHEGIVAAEAACGAAPHPVDYHNIPACTYCQPQVASIGLSEQAAKKAGKKYLVGKIPFSAIGKAVAIDEVSGFTKALIDSDTGEVLGMHILHSEATELIAEAAVIRSHEGIAASVIDTIHPHPTLSEAVLEALALAAGRPLNF